GWAALGVALEGGERNRGRHAAAAEFAVALERRRPEPRAAADHDGAGGVHHRERANREAVRRHRRGRADAAFEVDRGGAEAGADAAEREAPTRRQRRGIAEVAIGRKASPVLVAARDQPEQDRARHNPHPPAPTPNSPPPLP